MVVAVVGKPHAEEHAHDEHCQVEPIFHRPHAIRRFAVEYPSAAPAMMLVDKSLDGADA
jgi:hypothetical protein